MRPDLRFGVVIGLMSVIVAPLTAQAPSGKTPPRSTQATPGQGRSTVCGTTVLSNPTPFDPKIAKGHPATQSFSMRVVEPTVCREVGPAPVPAAARNLPVFLGPKR